MTGNQVKGRSFRGALRYNLEKVEKGVAEMLTHSFASSGENAIMKEVQMVRMLKPNLKKYFYHTSINFPYHEKLSNETMKNIGLDYLKENGFDQHQFLIFRHNDVDHPHLHILVNRIGYDGKVISDSNDYARSEKVLRALEKKYNLTQVTPSRQAKERAMTKNELEYMKRTNTPSVKMAMQVIINEILSQKNQMDTKEFIAALEAKKISILFNIASTGHVSGVSFSYNGVIMKGAKLGNDFKWTTLKNKIDYEQERDRTTIHEANLRTNATLADERANGGPHQRNKDHAQRDTTKLTKLPDKASDAGAFVRRPAQSPESTLETLRTIGNTNESTPQKAFSPRETSLLGSLLDSHRSGHNLSAADQPDHAHNVRRKRRKRRSLQVIFLFTVK